MTDQLFEAEPFRTAPTLGPYDEPDVPATWKPRARTADPTESKAAAASVTGLTEKRKAVLDCIATAGGPLTDYEMIDRYREWQADTGWPDQTDSGLRTRRSELAKAGYVVRAGKRALPTGRKAALWTVPGVTVPVAA